MIVSRVVLSEPSCENGWALIPRSLLQDDTISCEAKIFFVVLFNLAFSGQDTEITLSDQSETLLEELVAKRWAKVVAESVILRQNLPQVVENCVENLGGVVETDVENTGVIHTSSRARVSKLVVVGSSILPENIKEEVNLQLSTKLPTDNPYARTKLRATKKRKPRIDESVIQALIKECDIIHPDEEDMKRVAIVSSRLIKRFMNEHSCSKEEAILALPRIIAEKANIYRTKWPKIELTPFALANNWHKLTNKSRSSNVQDDIELAKRMESQGFL